MYNPADYDRRSMVVVPPNTAVMSLWEVFTDARRGATAAGETVGSTNGISYSGGGSWNNVVNAAGSYG